MSPVDPRVIVVPATSASTVLGAAQAILFHFSGQLVLGYSPEQFEAVKAKFNRRTDVYCEPLDWKNPKQWTTFFDCAYARFHRLDAILVGEEIWLSDGVTSEASIEVGIRTLLRCLDASIRYAGDNLHVVLVSPTAHHEMALSVASTYLSAKLHVGDATSFPTIQMTTVSTTATKEHPAGLPPRTHLLVQGGIVDRQPNVQTHRAKRASRKNAPSRKRTTIAESA